MLSVGRSRCLFPAGFSEIFGGKARFPGDGRVLVQAYGEPQLIGILCADGSGGGLPLPGNQLNLRDHRASEQQLAAHLPEAQLSR